MNKETEDSSVPDDDGWRNVVRAKDAEIDTLRGVRSELRQQRDELLAALKAIVEHEQAHAAIRKAEGR